MTFNDLAKQVAQTEGRKSQVKIGDVREILSIVSKMMVMDEEVEKTLLKNGQRLVNKEVRARGMKAGT
jgi:hypothetical protein